MIGTAASVALGVSLVLLAASLAVSAVLEGIGRLFNRRERFLFRSFGELLDGTPEPGPNSRTATLYRTTEFRTAVTGRERELMDGRRTTLRPWIGADECSRLRNFGPRHVRPGLVGAAMCRGPGDGSAEPWASWPAEPDLSVATPGDVADEEASAARWFDDAMRPVSGAYKAQTRGWLFALGLVLAVCANVDVLAIGQTLWDEPEAQSRIDAIAAQCDGAETSTGEPCDPQFLASELRGVRQLPLGWPCPADVGIDAVRESGVSDGGPGGCAFLDRFDDVAWQAVAGWILTAFGVMLGAPFWFDAVRRTVGAGRGR